MEPPTAQAGETASCNEAVKVDECVNKEEKRDSPAPTLPIPPHSALLVDASIDEHPVDMLAYRGAASSLVSRELYQFVEREKRLWNHQPADLAPGSVDGRPVDVLGHFETKLTVAKVQLTATIWAMPQMAHLGLLRLDVLYALEAGIHVPYL